MSSVVHSLPEACEEDLCDFLGAPDCLWFRTRDALGGGIVSCPRKRCAFAVRRRGVSASLLPPSFLEIQETLESGMLPSDVDHGVETQEEASLDVLWAKVRWCCPVQ